MNLFDILSNDERIIVFSDVGDRIIITWNQSQTLQMWEFHSSDEWGQTMNIWEELNVRILFEMPQRDFKAARLAAIAWFIHYR